MKHKNISIIFSTLRWYMCLKSFPVSCEKQQPHPVRLSKLQVAVCVHCDKMHAQWYFLQWITRNCISKISQIWINSFFVFSVYQRHLFLHIDVMPLVLQPTLLYFHMMSPLQDHFAYAPSQWKRTLHCNVVSHWLGAYAKLSLPLDGKMMPLHRNASPYCWPFVRGITGHHHKGPLMQSSDVSLDVSLNKPLNKHSNAGDFRCHGAHVMSLWWNGSVSLHSSLSVTCTLS